MLHMTWNGTFELLSNAVQYLKHAGAGVIVLGANTAHIVAERIVEATGLPLIDNNRRIFCMV